MKVTTANKVRLWIAGACQVVAIILSIALAFTFQYSSTLDVTAANGDLLAPLALPMIFEIAAAVLAAISLWRFVSPRAEPAPAAPAAPPPPAPGAWGYPPPPGAAPPPQGYYPPPPPQGRDVHND